MGSFGSSLQSSHKLLNVFKYLSLISIKLHIGITTVNGVQFLNAALSVTVTALVAPALTTGMVSLESMYASRKLH